MKKRILTIAFSLITIPTLALADGHRCGDDDFTLKYNGPTDLASVSELLKDTGMFSEQDVIVEGKLVKRLSADTYLFSDGVKEIQVEFDDDIRITETLDDAKTIRLFGEYEGGGTPEIEVEHLQVL
ncbi:YgiW/YdeI family stress tolerance OB fold protein [Vibrio sonorensis]|uniref:YgiW/YdeI family stress tolerance OB fold protein n=1 Tax=Vibrio sonorensis TaxID=1004316 RepID=UPI0008DACF96|nr:NirD/YgiW/YdeI family stress tolerance protein [Vibrio sonorensis]